VKLKCFNKKKSPTVSDYNRIIHLAEKCFDDIDRLLNVDRLLNFKENESAFYLLSLSAGDKIVNRLCRGNVIDHVIWLTTLNPNLALVNSWEITKEQYKKLYIKEYVEEQLEIEGFKVTHFHEKG